jgi:tetratricopeptide (TPR) repeat protein
MPHCMVRWFIMMITEIPSPPSYSDIFLRQVINSLRYAIDSVRGKTVLDESSRDHALHNVKLGLEHPQAWSCARELLLLLAPIMEQAGWREDWIPYLEMGLTQSVTFSDWKATGDCHFWLGFLWQRIGKYAKAETHFQSSAEAFEVIEDITGKGRGLMRMAHAVVQQRRFQEGNILAERAYLLVEGSPLERGYYYLILENIARERQDHEHSYQLAVSCLAEWRKTNNSRFIGWGLSNLAVTLFRTERYLEAEDYYLQALDCLIQVEDPIHIAIVEFSLGSISLMRGNYLNALKWYSSFEATMRIINELPQLAQVTNSIGMAYHGLGAWEHAEEFYLESIALFEQLGNLPWAANTRDNLALTYVAQQYYLKAIVVLKKGLDDLESNPDDASFAHFHAMLSDTWNSITLLQATETALKQHDYNTAIYLLEIRLKELRSIPNSNNFSFFLAHLTHILESIRNTRE